MYPIYNHNWRNISTIYIYIYNKTSIERNILTIKKIHREVGPAKDFSAPLYCTILIHLAFFSQKQRSALYDQSGWDSSVGIATPYWLEVPEIESRCGARISASVQTLPGAHPASYTIGTASFPRGKEARGVALTTHPPSSTEVK